MRRLIFFFASIVFYHISSAAIVDTVSIYSKAMGIYKKCVVIKPNTSKKGKERFPTVYLLHGYGGKHSDWIIKVPQLKEYVDNHKIIVVCPDGDYSSWYFDSPLNATFKYETYIGKEVPLYIDTHYPTIQNRNSRAITGLSMGGHGALFISMRHTSFFGAAGSMSGVVDISSTRNKYDLMKRIGDTVIYSQNWKTHSVINALDEYAKKIAISKSDTLKMIVDCGIEDVFYRDNKRLHEKMVHLKIPHNFIARTGNHNWSYWGNAIQYQLLFFKKYFEKARDIETKKSSRKSF